MLLAINYSHPAARLVSQGVILVDRFKCPGWPEMIAEAKELLPVLVHFDLKAGNGNLMVENWEFIRELLETTKTPFFNLHLNPTIKNYPDMQIDTIESNHRDLVISRAIMDVNSAKANLPHQEIILENVNYRRSDGKTMRLAVEPVFIKRTIEETGSGLLLDISHARISAHALDMDVYEYMSLLPVDRLRELHFTGLHSIDGRLVDHLPIIETDWPILEWTLERIKNGDWAKPWLLALEYGGVGEKYEKRSDEKVIAEQVPLLYEKIRSRFTHI